MTVAEYVFISRLYNLLIEFKVGTRAEIGVWAKAKTSIKTEKATEVKVWLLLVEALGTSLASLYFLKGGKLWQIYVPAIWLAW